MLKQDLFGDASVCYSGGLDSTFVSYQAALKNKGRVHLHTLDHGFGYLFNGWAFRSSRTLARAVGEDRVRHALLDTSDLFKELAIKTLLTDGKRYKHWFGCCLGCTMAMVTKIIIYNLENRVPHIMMGSSVGGQYAVMSMPVTIGLQKEYCGRYGIVYSAPLVEEGIVKEVERQTLDAAGVFRGLRFWDKHSFGNQGYCLLSLQHVPDVVWNVHPVYDPEQVRRFFLDKLPRCEAYIARHFERKGQDMGPLVAALKALTGAGRADAQQGGG